MCVKEREIDRLEEEEIDGRFINATSILHNIHSSQYQHSTVVEFIPTWTTGTEGTQHGSSRPSTFRIPRPQQARSCPPTEYTPQWGSLTHSLTHCSALLCSSLLLDDHHSIGDYVSYDYKERRYKYTLIEHNRIISLHIHTFCSHSLIVDG